MTGDREMTYAQYQAEIAGFNAEAIARSAPMPDTITAELLDACIQARSVLVTAKGDGGDAVRQRVLADKIALLSKVIDKARGLANA